MNARITLFCLIGFVPAIALAEPIELRIVPPDVPRHDLCVPQESVAEVQARWASGTWPNGRTHAQIRRDITVLRKEDAAGNLVLIQSIIEGLAVRGSKFAGKRALLAEIEALRAAGALQEIKSRQLVQKLAAQSTGTSAQVTRALARFYQDGLGVAPDPKLADHYLMQAANLGHPDAVLTLAERRVQGSAPIGWKEPVRESVQNAFDALTTPLNAGVCERSARIARAYFSGTLVQKDAELGQVWLRFAADLGDAQAAWKIYEEQRLAEDVEPDTTLRLTYLAQAADAGLPFAQIALGRVYELGALVPQDLPRALEMYQKAAGQGHRAGLIRLALFLETHRAEFRELEGTRLEALVRLAEMETPPAWVSTRLANHKMEAGYAPSTVAGAKALYEEAAALGDREAMTRLAELLLMNPSNAAAFFRAVDLLSEAVALHGSTGAAKKLYDAYMCKAPDSPRLDEAMYWKAQYAAADPALQPVDAGNVAGVAALQSQALYRRNSALESWVSHLKEQHGAPALLAFWDGYTENYGQLLKAQSAYDQFESTDVQWRQDAKAVLAEVNAREGLLTMTALDRALRRGEWDLEALLVKEVNLGSGAALRLLAAARGKRIEETIAPHLERLVKFGDFDALNLAAPLAENPERMLDRAIGIMPCDFKSAMTLHRTAARIGNTARVAAPDHRRSSA